MTGPKSSTWFVLLPLSKPIPLLAESLDMKLAKLPPI